MKTRLNIKARLVTLGKKCIDCIGELNKQGISCSAAAFSTAINVNVQLTEKFTEIVNAADRIITEWENEERRKQ